MKPINPVFFLIVAFLSPLAYAGATEELQECIKKVNQNNYINSTDLLNNKKTALNTVSLCMIDMSWDFKGKDEKDPKSYTKPWYKFW